MSKDFRPIDHILWSIELVASEKTNGRLIEPVYLEMTFEDGKTIPLNDKECCERFPYVSFFGEWINDAYRVFKDNPEFIKKMESLEKALKDIVDEIEKRYTECRKASGYRKLNLTGVFDSAKDEFPYLCDFILSRNEFYFGYDSRCSNELFARKFLEEFDERTEEREER